MVLVPLRHVEGEVGQLQVLSKELDAFTEDDVSTLELLSVALSSAMSHAAEFEAKRAQVEALARFETVYEGAPIGIALVSPDARIVESNPAFGQMLGYDDEELAGMAMQRLVHPDEIQSTAQLLDEMMDGQRDFYSLEGRFVRKDGELVWGQVATALQRDADGKPKFAISMVEIGRASCRERVYVLV